MNFHPQQAYEIAQKRIAQTHLAPEKGLDLSWLGLTKLPPEIIDLKLAVQITCRKAYGAAPQRAPEDAVVFED